MAFGAPLHVASCQNATVTKRSGPIGVAGPTGVGDDDRPAGDRSDPLAPVALLPPPHPATTPTKSTDALADNILGDIEYLLSHRRHKRITARERLLSLTTNLQERFLHFGLTVEPKSSCVCATFV